MEIPNNQLESRIVIGPLVTREPLCGSLPVIDSKNGTT